MYKIDKNIPIPSKYSKGIKTKYPWRELEVGDSFFVENRTSTQMINTSKNTSKNSGHKYVCRKEGNGCRVWRVA